MSYSNGLLQLNTNNIAGIKGKDGKDGVGYKLTSSGDYNLENKIIYNLKTQDDVPDDTLASRAPSKTWPAWQSLARPGFRVLGRAYQESAAW